MPAAAEHKAIRAKYMGKLIPFLGEKILEHIEDSHYTYGEEITKIVKSHHAQVANALCVCCSLPPSPYILHHIR